MSTFPLRTLALTLTFGLAAVLLPGCDSFLFFGDSEASEFSGTDCPTDDLACYCEQNPENCE